MKNGLSMIMLAVIVAIVIFGTVCLFMGNFAGAYATFPFLFVYYVWVIAMKRRKNRREETDSDQDGSDAGR